MLKTPQFWLQKNSLISLILLPFCLIYKVGFLLKKFLVKTQKVNLPIICIGNIIAGGSGKTPVALALGDFLKKNNFEFCYLTRGYKSNINQVLIIDKHSNTNAQDVGDEAMLLADIAPTCVAKNRYLGYKKILENNKYQMIVMDDGLQNFQLDYALKILVIDSKIAFGNERLIPSGPLRQSLSDVAKNIDLFVIIGQKNLTIEKKIFQENPQSKILSAQIFASNLDKFLNQNIVAFCGIAYPQKFFDFVKNNGLNLIDTKAFADHYQYKIEDLEKLYQEAFLKNYKLITTKKDWVKFPKIFQEKIDYLDIKLEFEDETLLKNLLKYKLN